MIHLMLTDLCRPSAEFHLLLFPVHIIVLYFYVFVSCCFSHTCKRKTSFFCFIWSIFSQHYRIKHHNINQPYIYNDHSLFDSDHICCHSHAAGTVDFQCILKIFPYRNIRLCCRLGFLSQKENIFYDCSDPFLSILFSNNRL